MKPKVSAIIKITIQGTEIELTAKEAEEIVEALTSVLPRTTTPFEYWKPLLREPEQPYKHPMIPPPYPYKDFYRSTDGREQPPGTITCRTEFHHSSQCNSGPHPPINQEQGTKNQ